MKLKLFREPDDYNDYLFRRSDASPIVFDRHDDFARFGRVLKLENNL